MKLTHAKLVKLAAKYLRKQGCCVVLTELSSMDVEEADAIGWNSGGYSTLVECKATRADFRVDAKKPHRRRPETGVGYKRFYLAPEGLLTRDDLPLGWGLLEASERGYVRETHHALPKEYAQMKETKLLLSVVRRFGNTPGVRGVNIAAYTFKDIRGNEYASVNRATVGVSDG